MWPSEHLDSVDSTQREALRRIAAMGALDRMALDRAPFILWTTRQTQGIGSHGRQWTDSGHGLACSTAWPEALMPASFGAWPIRISLLVVDRLARRYPALGQRLGVKWPNDIMAGRAKLGGVLVSRHRIGGQWWLVAGVGINLGWQTPLSLDRPVTDLVSLGIPNPAAELLVADLAEAIRDQLISPWSAEDLMQRFSQADIFAGIGVSVIHPIDGRLVAQGISHGISEMGALLLQTTQEQLEVQIGELSLRESEAVS
jgi:BirA family biotin operon repressor/biotin-[acetyl-CoA-carboxylase] ligase